MKMKVVIDFDMINDKESMDILEKISQIYQTDLFILADDVNKIKSLETTNLTIYLKEEKEVLEYIIKVSKEYDWVLAFTKEIKEAEREKNIIYLPTRLKGNLEIFKNISFTEHAKNKKYYHDFSNYYMETLANDTPKEAQF